MGAVKTNRKQRQYMLAPDEQCLTICEARREIKEYIKRLKRAGFPGFANNRRKMAGLPLIRRAKA